MLLPCACVDKVLLKKRKKNIQMIEKGSLWLPNALVLELM
jgi:hypothetical protein